MKAPVVMSHGPTPGALGEGEQMLTVRELPVLARETKREGTLPLVVLLPGGGHLARIFYGHDGADRTQFLAHWLSELGFGSLALSYPGGHPVFPACHPELTPREWGIAAAEATASTIRRRGLLPNVLLCVWSMAGRMVYEFSRAAADRGLSIDVCISLAASAPLPGLASAGDETLSEEGLWDIAVGSTSRPPRLTRFIDELMHRSPAPPLTEANYRAHYLNPHAIALRGEAQRWGSLGSYRDTPAAQEEVGLGRWIDFPICGAIVPREQSDLRHALTDGATWTLFTAQTIAARLEPRRGAMETEVWQQLIGVFDTIPQLLVRRADGGHLFFVGSAGARQTAEFIAELRWAACALLARVAALTGRHAQGGEAVQ